MRRFVTASYDWRTQENKPWLTSNESLAYVYSTEDAANAALRILRQLGFAPIVKPQPTLNGNFRLEADAKLSHRPVGATGLCEWCGHSGTDCIGALHRPRAGAVICMTCEAKRNE